MRWWQITWLFKMELFSGMLFLCVQSRIGRWRWYFLSSLSFILISVWHGADDKLVWSLSKRGLFEVKSYYEVLNRKDGPSFPWKSIWCVKAPARVAFFV
jgi:hypothetical protein